MFLLKDFIFLVIVNSCSHLVLIVVLLNHIGYLLYSQTQANAPFAFVHSDVWGPFSPSTTGYKYYVLFIDDFSKFTWVISLYFKSKVFSKLLEFKAAEKHFGFPLKILRTDGSKKLAAKIAKRHRLQFLKIRANSLIIVHLILSNFTKSLISDPQAVV